VGWDFLVDTIDVSAVAAAVPEPATIVPALGGAALVGLGYAWRKRRATV
jgi:hypothetical protein